MRRSSHQRTKLPNSCVDRLLESWESTLRIFMNRIRPGSAPLLVSLLLAACGGGDATIGGTLSGLPSGDTVTLQNNGANDLKLTSNGTFEFSGTVSDGSAYVVTVSVQPAAASCGVGNASGTVDANGSDVSNITVTCTATASIVGTVSGLASGAAVTLINSGSSGSGTAAPLAIASNGLFAFPGIKTAGTSYNVTVSVQPVNQTCTVTGGTGTVVANTTTSISVACN